MKMFKRWRKKGVCVVLACMLALTPVGSGIASAAIAEDSAIAQSELTVKAAATTIVADGSCGAVSENNVKWTLYSSGLLEFTGSGAMEDYYCYKYKSGSSYYYVTDVPWYSYKSQIKTIKIGSGITNIGDYAFVFCTNATSISMASSVTSIGDYALYDCESLTSISMPSVKTIGSYALYYCESLSSVTIPSSVTTIYDYAFAYCKSLQSVTFKGSAPEIGDHAFYETAATLVFYYPAYDSSWSSARKSYGNENGPTWSGYKGSQSISVTAKTFKKTLKAKQLKKKKKTFKLKAKATGKVTYKKVSGSNKIKVNNKGKVTVKKGTKKGTYKVQVQVTAKATSAYNQATKTQTLTIKVK